MTGVVLAVSSHAEDAIAAAIAAHPDLTLERRCADLAEALAAASAGVADVAVLSPQRHLDRVTVGEFHHMRVRVLGVAVDEREERALAALGVTSVRATDPQAIADAAARPPAAEPLPAVDVPPARPQGRIIAVWGPTGAPGRTSIAVNLAAEFARERRTLLVDLDTHGAAIAQSLAIHDEAPGIAALARAAARGEADSAAVMRHAVTAGANLSVLTGLPRPGRWTEIPAQALDGAWPAMRAAAPVTVIDCGFSFAEAGSRRDEATAAALAQADAVVAVGGAEPVGMQRLVDALGDVTEAMPGVKDRMLVAVNRVRRSVAGPQPERQVADALARYAGIGAVWTIPWDLRTADLAALRGETWREAAARGPASQAVGRLAVAIAERLDVADLSDTPARSSGALPALTD